MPTALRIEQEPKLRGRRKGTNKREIYDLDFTPMRQVKDIPYDIL